MKNIFVAAVFLFSQLGLTAEKATTINSNGYHIENEKLSGLILTKEELSNLNDNDKTTYLFSMIALAQIVEAAQGDTMGYDNSLKNTKTSGLNLNRLNFIASLLPQAQAWGFLVNGAIWLASTEVIGLAGSYVMKRISGRAIAALGEKTAEAVASTAAAKAMQLGSKEAIAAGKEAVLLNLKNFKTAQEALAAGVKSKASPAQIQKLAAQAKEAELNAKKANYVFRTQGGTEKELIAMTKESKVWNYIKNNISTFVGGALITHGLDTYMKESTGFFNFRNNCRSNTAVWRGFGGTA